MLAGPAAASSTEQMNVRRALLDPGAVQGHTWQAPGPAARPDYRSCRPTTLLFPVGAASAIGQFVGRGAVALKFC